MLSLRQVVSRGLGLLGAPPAPRFSTQQVLQLRETGVLQLRGTGVPPAATPWLQQEKEVIHSHKNKIVVSEQLVQWPLVQGRVVTCCACDCLNETVTVFKTVIL